MKMSLVRTLAFDIAVSLWQARWPMVSALDSESSGLVLNHETMAGIIGF